jgi:hypothetical protein
MTARALSLAVVAVVMSIELASPAVHAQPGAPSPAAVAEAGKHFQRGVTMYNEADYRAALVEFRRAYETAPNAAVLYNIGQTYYQLQNYAAALVALGRYLTEAGSSAAHRREVEATIDTLQTRVGKVAITTNLPGCDITVDDELVGKSPLDEPVLVSIGRRKITSLRDGRVTETRFVDVAAGDTVNVALSAGDPGGKNPDVSKVDPGPSSTTVMVAWGITGGLGLLTAASGLYSLKLSNDLSDARGKMPADAASLKSQSDKVNLWSKYITNGLLVATAVSAAVSIRFTLSRSATHEAHVAVVPGGVQLAGTFR